MFFILVFFILVFGGFLFLLEYSDASLYFMYMSFLFFLFGVLVFGIWYKLFSGGVFSLRGFFLSSYDVDYPLYSGFLVFFLVVAVSVVLNYMGFYFFRVFLGMVVGAGDLQYVLYLVTVLLGFYCMKFFVLDGVGMGLINFLSGLFSFGSSDIYLGLQGFLLSCFILSFVSLFNTGMITVYSYYYEHSVEEFEGGGKSMGDLFEESGSSGYSVSYLDEVFGGGDFLTLSSLLFVFLVVVLAPFFEEFVFRGILLVLFSERLGVIASNMLVSFMFALVHFDMYSFLPLFVLGFMLGLVYLRSGVLVSSVLLHSLWNGQAVLTYIILYI